MPSVLPQLQSSPFPLQETYEALRLDVREDSVNLIVLVGMPERIPGAT